MTWLAKRLACALVVFSFAVAVTGCENARERAEKTIDEVFD